MASAPLVSVVVPAYNYERFLPRALDSIVAQDHPPEGLDVVVVDDGSTDRTAEIVASYGSRLRYVYQENGGLIAAINRGFAEARGELVTIVSADDTCPPDRVRRQAELLERRPEVGLVYGDMEVIDADDRVIYPSYFAATGTRPRRGRVLGTLLTGNFVTGAAIMVRASLTPHFHPIDERVAIWEDWWIATHVAQVAEIDFLEQPVARYRLHGENMNFGTQGPELVELLRREIPFRRWLLSTVRPGNVTAAELVAAHTAFERHVALVAAHTGVEGSTLV